MLRRMSCLALTLAVAAAPFACRAGGGDDGEPGPFPQAPVVLVSIDTLRSDHLPSYGYGGGATPASCKSVGGPPSSTPLVRPV